jgi:hypothetical protein
MEDQAVYESDPDRSSPHTTADVVELEQASVSESPREVFKSEEKPLHWDAEPFSQQDAETEHLNATVRKLPERVGHGLGISERFTSRPRRRNRA